MLPKNFRLNKSQIALVLRKGQKSESDFFKNRILSNRLSHSRFAVVISSKTIKLATKRNLLRRKIYTILSSIQKTEKNFDLCIHLKSATEKLNHSDLKTAVNENISKAIQNLNHG